MKTLIVSFLISLSAFSSYDFSLKGHDGKTYSLSDYKGKIVVLEWFNHGCPFVRKHYDSSNMQNLQKKYKNKVVWLTINSSNVGKQGYLKDTVAAKKIYEQEEMESKALLIDTDGTVGRRYKAKTTPHMFVINKDGKLIYEGAIDSIASANSSDIESSENYVDMVLTKIVSGKSVKYTRNKAYGCSVKY